MAQSVLVCQTVGSARRLSFAPAAEGRPPVLTSLQTETRVPASGVSTRLEAVQRSLKEIEFSQAASAQISKGNRQSSRVVYDSKWRLFYGWCEEHEVNPFEVTVPQLADFFIYLFNVKRLNPRTSNGDRSAISECYGFGVWFTARILGFPGNVGAFTKLYVGAPSTTKHTPSVEPPFDFTGPSETSLSAEVRTKTFNTQNSLPHSISF